MTSNSLLNEIGGLLNNQSPEQTGIKRCNNCRKLLPKSEFHKSRNRPGGLTNECKTCSSNRHKTLYKGHRWLRIIYNVIARRAKHQGTTFHITFEDFCHWEKDQGKTETRKCPYCGLTVKESKALQKLRGKKRLCGFTMDRIDNQKRLFSREYSKDLLYL